jgi:hypothetical protein
MLSAFFARKIFQALRIRREREIVPPFKIRCMQIYVLKSGIVVPRIQSGGQISSISVSPEFEVGAQRSTLERISTHNVTTDIFICTLPIATYLQGSLKGCALC